MQSVTDDSGTTTYGYDDQGNLIQSATSEGTLHYGFNALGQHIRTWTTPTPASSQIYTDLSYSYDPQGRLSTVTASMLNGTTLSTPQTTTYTYDAVGNKLTETLPNGVTSTWGYTDNQLTSLTETKSGVTLFSQSYVLNGDGTKHSSTSFRPRPMERA